MLCLGVELNIPKSQCSFILFTTTCIVGGVTSPSLSLVLYTMSPQSFQTAETRNLKSVYCEYVFIDDDGNTSARGDTFNSINTS